MDNATAPPDTAPDSSSGSTTAEGNPPESTSPIQPTEADVPLLSSSQELEFTIRDLYDAAVDAGLIDDESTPVFVTMRENHEEYANSIAGLVGESAVPRSREVYDKFADRFTTTDITELAAAAYDLESMLVATHPEVIGELVGTDGADALAAAVIVEARQASALAAVAGKLDDLDVMLVNSAEPVSLTAATDLLAAATATTEG